MAIRKVGSVTVTPNEVIIKDFEFDDGEDGLEEAKIWAITRLLDRTHRNVKFGTSAENQQEMR